jgi:dipeptidyl-peptidase 4
MPSWPAARARSSPRHRHAARPAGTANAVVSLHIASLDAAAPGKPVGLTAVDWDNRAMEYLTAAGWDETGPYAAVQRRDQRLVQVLGIDADTGQTRVLAEVSALPRQLGRTQMFSLGAPGAFTLSTT